VLLIEPRPAQELPMAQRYRLQSTDPERAGPPAPAAAPAPFGLARGGPGDAARAGDSALALDLLADYHLTPEVRLFAS
jgi:hypothetical protein